MDHLYLVKYSFCLTVLVATVQAVPNNCSTQYQAALQQVMDLKETCSEAVFSGCCEVHDFYACILYRYNVFVKFVGP